MAVGPFYGSSASGVYKSTNGGSTWTLLSGVPSGTGDGRISIAVAPSNTNVVYVSIAGNVNNYSPGTGYGLYKFERSDDGGPTWTDLTAGTPNYMGGQGWYDQTLIVSPTNSSVVFAGGVEDYSAGGIDDIIESTNAGATWTSINIGADGTGPHTDDHGMTFDASGRLIDGNDGGIWRLDNATIGSIQWTDLNTRSQHDPVRGHRPEPDRPDDRAGRQPGQWHLAVHRQSRLDADRRR